MEDPEVLFQGLLHGSLGARRANVQALGETGDPRAPGLLCRALSEWQVREAAARALVRVGPPAVPAVCEALRSEESEVRACAADILGQIGDASGVPALCAALQDPEASVRASAIRALARIGGPSVVPPLIEMLRYPEWETPRAAAEALGRIGDRRAILPLWEALLDAPAELDPAFSQALQKIARRQPGPELWEVLRRLERELLALDGESRKSLEEARWHLLRAAAPLEDLPIPAAGPAPPVASLPLPAAPAAPAAENLPLPAARPGHETEHPPDGLSEVDGGLAGVQTPTVASELSNPAWAAAGQSGVRTPAVENRAAIPRPAPTASEAILSRFCSVEGEAVRTWAGLRPVRAESDIVFRRGMSGASLEKAADWALLALISLGLLAEWLFSSHPSSWSVPLALVLLSLTRRKLPAGLRRLYFKVDSAAQEVVIYPLLVGRRSPKRKRLPLDQIDYFLGHLWNASDGMGDRLYAVLPDGSLEALTDNLGADCHVEVNTRILGVTCGKPAYLLDGRAKVDDLIAVRADGGFTVRSRAKLLEQAQRLHAPEEELEVG